MQSIIEDFGGIAAGLKRIEEAKGPKPAVDATNTYYGHEWVAGQYVPCARPDYDPTDPWGFMG